MRPDDSQVIMTTMNLDYLDQSNTPDILISGCDNQSLDPEYLSENTDSPPYDPKGSLEEIEAQIELQRELVNSEDLSATATLGQETLASGFQPNDESAFTSPLSFNNVGTVPVITDNAKINITLPTPPDSSRSRQGLFSLVQKYLFIYHVQIEFNPFWSDCHLSL